MSLTTFRSVQRGGPPRVPCLAAGVALCAAAGGAAAGPVAYVTALFEDSVYRLEDLNGDNDTHDAGEATVYFGPGNASGFPGVGSAQCVLVLQDGDVLVADGEETGGFFTAVYRLRDINGDGDAMDPGEAWIYWDAQLPPPYASNYDRPKQMIELPDGSVMLADNNTINLDNDSPEAVWLLTDRNGDDDADEFNEIELYKELAPPGDAFGFVTEQFERLPDGRVLFSNLDSSTNTVNLWAIENDAPRTLTPVAGTGDIPGIVWREQGMALSPFTGVPMFTATDINEDSALVEVTDLTGDGDCNDPGEFVVRYLASTSAVGLEWNYTSTFDMAVAPDESVWLIDFAGLRIVRFKDLDGDSLFQSAGEAGVVYDAFVAAANGAATTNFPRAIAFEPDDPCPADLTGDGLLNNSDINTFVSAFIGGNLSADLTGDGLLNNSDINAFVSAFLSGCG